jgi:hypothetical protein
MLVEHCDVSVSGGGDLGDSFPFANILPPIVLDGFEAVGDMSFLIWGLNLDFMFSH